MSREPSELPQFLLVTGTDTAVGKTVATAALAVHHGSSGRSVAAVKPVQTGRHSGEPGDIDVVRRLAGLRHAHELVRLPEPLAPESAARRSGADLPTVETLADRIAGLAGDAALVLVEGAGGVTVRLDAKGGTLLDLGRAMQWHGSVAAVVVVRAGLGTLNHTVLTVDALRAADIGVAGLVVGAWPSAPDLAATANREDLPRITGCRLLAVLPAGAGSLDPETFRRQVPDWFADQSAGPVVRT